MQLRAEYLMKAVSHCLASVVAPAIDKSNGVAREQVAIAVGLLEFMAAREPLQFEFDCNELISLISLAERLDALKTWDPEASGAVEQAHAVLARAQAGPAEIAAASRSLREFIRVAIDALHAEGGAARSSLKKEILAQAGRALSTERAWFAPLGFERGAQALPPLEELLRKAR